MAGMLSNFFGFNSEAKKDKEKDKSKRKNMANGLSGAAVEDSVNTSIQTMNETYAKPEYTGNRSLYDSQKAKVDFKKQAFSSGKVKDPYTGKILEAKIKVAKAKYGDDWAKHVAEVDHIDPLAHVADTYKDSAFVTTKDIQEAANQEDNLQVLSRQVNNAKRDRTNQELAEDTAYRKDKNLKLSKKSLEKMKETGEAGEDSVAWEIRKSQLGNVAKEVHTAGFESAKAGMAIGGTLSVVDNMVAVINGEKDADEALGDLAKDVALTGAVSYGVGGGVAAAGHMLSTSSSPFIQNLVKAGVPGKVVGVVMATGNTLVRYANGEINTGECIRELGRTGINTAVTGYTMAAGQAMIPIPLVGAAVGALVGTAICGALRNPISDVMNQAQQAREEAEEWARYANAVTARLKEQRETFELAVAQLLCQRQQAFDSGYGAFVEGSKNNDFDAMAQGLNRICNSFGDSLGVQSFEEFDAMMSDDSVEIKL